MTRLVQPVVEPGALRDQDQPDLAGKMVALRPWRRSDASIVVDAYADPDIQLWNLQRLDRTGRLDRRLVPGLASRDRRQLGGH